MTDIRKLMYNPITDKETKIDPYGRTANVKMQNRHSETCLKKNRTDFLKNQIKINFITL